MFLNRFYFRNTINLKKYYRSTRLIIIAFLLSSTFAAIWHPFSPLVHNNPAGISPSNQTKEIFRREWEEKIKANPARAYSEFKQVYLQKPDPDQHEFAHLFGELLYTNTGKQGIKICDESFTFGCYHSYIAAAIGTEGIQVTSELNIHCLDLNDQTKTGACQHGLGHGLVSYFGYSPGDLQEALQICNMYNKGNQSGSCSGGIYMEYNLRTMLSDTKTGSRIFNPENPYEPCNTLPDEYHSGCIFNQTQWWLDVIPGEIKTRLEKIDRFCSLLQDNSKTQCYSGLGNFLGSFLDWNADLTRDYCNNLIDQNNRILCRENAANVFNKMLKQPESAQLLCVDNDSTVEKYCLSRAGIN